MKITKHSEYAIRAMIHLASNGNHTVTNISEVSARWEIPESILRKIIPHMRRAGFIRSIRGNTGGITLARDAQLITPLDIIETIEGDVVLNQCLVNPDICNRTEACAMHNVWSQARDQLRQTLCSISIHDLVYKNYPDVLPINR